MTIAIPVNNNKVDNRHGNFKVLKVFQINENNQIVSERIVNLINSNVDKFVSMLLENNIDVVLTNQLDAEFVLKLGFSGIDVEQVFSIEIDEALTEFLNKIILS